MAYGLTSISIDDDNWHMIPGKVTLSQTSTDAKVRIGDETNPGNDELGIEVSRHDVLSNSDRGATMWIKRLNSRKPLSVTVTGDL